VDRAILALIDRQYLARPYYGSRRMAAWLRRKVIWSIANGCGADGLMGLVAIYQARTRARQPTATRSPVSAWRFGSRSSGSSGVGVDVTYIPMAKGCLYLVVIMDWVKPRGGWRGGCRTRSVPISVSRRRGSAVRYGRPEIFNTDQGSQFTSDGFTAL